MRIGIQGAGKLGLPFALAVEERGHTVLVNDTDLSVQDILEFRELPYREQGAQELLDHHQIRHVDVAELVKNSDILFCAIQTPHDRMYEGVTRLPKSRIDFDYSYLKEGVGSLCSEIGKLREERIIAIISTVLPGTIEREIRPLLNDNLKLVYNPFFIAMGTTIDDFLNPEFVLLGVDDPNACETLTLFYETIHDRKCFKCTIEEAEMIKVSYNTFITTNIAVANTVMEMSEKLQNITCDVVMGALGMATDRIISTKYLKGGMGDGGGCHPRDNIALSWLSRECGMSYDWYENLMMQRQSHTLWMAVVVKGECDQTGLDPVILGKSFKPETDLTVGSPALLLANLLNLKSMRMFDPWVDEGEAPLDTKAVFFIATNHEVFKTYRFPEGSVVIDPFRSFEFMVPQDGVRFRRLGDSTKLGPSFDQV